MHGVITGATSLVGFVVWGAAVIHNGIHKHFASVADVAVVFWQVGRKYVALTMNSVEQTLGRYIIVSLE